MVGCIFTKLTCLLLLQIKSKVLLKKMSKSKNSHKYEDKNKSFLT